MKQLAILSRDILSSFVLGGTYIKDIKKNRKKKLVCRSEPSNPDLVCQFILQIKACLVPHLKNFHLSNRIFGHMPQTLNVDKKIN